jgi:hypothetical protein
MLHTLILARTVAFSRSFILRLTLAFAGMGSIAAADYSINPNGHDSNTGTSAVAPWRSLGKVNTTVVQPKHKASTTPTCGAPSGK